LLDSILLAVTVIAITLLFVLLAREGTVQRSEAAVLLVALAAYLAWAYFTERSGVSPAASVHAAEADALEAIPRSLAWSACAVILGLLLLISGSRLVLAGAIGVAQGLGVSEALIGLTLVAVGTSLPELTISLIAALRRQADVAVGNILGSNIFNVLGILGVAASVQPLPVSNRIAAVDQWVMLAAALAVFVLLLTGRRINRFEGALLLGAYVAYVVASYLDAVP
jgi:cation:H+ antiporter